MESQESQPISQRAESVSHVSGPLTLSVDCGGGSIKAAVCASDGALVSTRRRVPVVYPFSVDDWIQTLANLIEEAYVAGFRVDRLSVGMPGMIRGGTVVFTPHYIRADGPHTAVLESLAQTWNGLPASRRLKERFGIPAIVVNDSEMHGAALITGIGLEVTLTFGTGLGSAHFHNGALQAHLELSHAQFAQGTTYDQYIGEHVRLKLGDQAWSERIVEVVTALYPVFRWDMVYIGGGNAHNLTASALGALTDIGFPVRVVANRVALSGGPKLWES